MALSGTNLPFHPLLVIDDAALRRKAFAEAEKILKKLDKLEATLNAFRGDDQKRFEEWVQLTFRDEKEKAEALHVEYERLRKWRTWVTALEEQFELTEEEAYQIVKEEAAAFAAGDAAEREKIETDRWARESFLREEQTRRDREEFEENKAREEEAAPPDLAEELFPTDEPRPDDAGLMEELRNLDEASLSHLYENLELATQSLARCLTFCRARDDYFLFLRLYDGAPTGLREALGDNYFEATGLVLGELVQEIREALGWRPPPLPEEEEDDDFEIPEEQTSDQEERLKLLYRKLVRLLHPDLRRENAFSGKMSPWQQEIWDRALAAYERCNLPELEQLYHTTLLRSRRLNDLSLGEIWSSRQWLNRELDHMRSQTRRFHRLPAWNFSGRRDFKPLHRKISRQLTEECLVLGLQIDRLRNHFDRLDRSSERTKHFSR